MEASDNPWLPRQASRRKAAIRLGASYAAGLTSAHILAAGAVTLMIVSLSRNGGGDPEGSRRFEADRQ
jgi:adenylate cyclase